MQTTGGTEMRVFVLTYKGDVLGVYETEQAAKDAVWRSSISNKDECWISETTFHKGSK